MYDVQIIIECKKKTFPHVQYYIYANLFQIKSTVYHFTTPRMIWLQTHYYGLSESSHTYDISMVDFRFSLSCSCSRPPLCVSARRTFFFIIILAGICSSETFTALHRAWCAYLCYFLWLLLLLLLLLIFPFPNIFVVDYVHIFPLFAWKLSWSIQVHQALSIF